MLGCWDAWMLRCWDAEMPGCCGYRGVRSTLGFISAGFSNCQLDRAKPNGRSDAFLAVRTCAGFQKQRVHSKCVLSQRKTQEEQKKTNKDDILTLKDKDIGNSKRVSRRTHTAIFVIEKLFIIFKVN